MTTILRRRAFALAAGFLAPALLGLGVLAGLSGPALALSSACSTVNSGTYNLTNSGSFSADLGSGFEAGESVTFVVTGTGGNFEILIDGSIAQQITPSATPVTLIQTMTTALEDLSLFYRGTGGFRVTFTATCSSGGPPTQGATTPPTRGIVKGFLLSRLNGLLLNSPASTSLLYRSNGIAGGTSAGAGGIAPSFSGLGNILTGSAGGSSVAGTMGLGTADPAAAGNGNMSFATSLSQVRRDAARAQMEKDRMSLGAGDGATLPAAFEIDSPWDAWAEGRFSGFNNDARNLDGSGHVGLLFVGSDYRITPDMIVGALAQFDWADDETGLLASKVDGNGWMAGPYLSARMYENIYLDLRAAWGRSSNDLAIAATTSSFDTSRWLVKGTLAGNWLYDCWRITPSAELAYVTESQNSFTNSAGALVPGQDVSLGRLQFGPEVGYRFAHAAGTLIEPFAAIKGVWDFDNPNVQVIDGLTVGPGDFWARLEGGLNVMTPSGWYVRGQASWDGLGASGYNGYTLQGILNVPLN